MDPGKVWALTLAFRRPQLSLRVIEALLRQQPPPASILLIDNGGERRIGDLVDSQYRGAVRVLRLPRNAGVAGGYAEGMRFAIGQGADWVWLNDDDVVAEPDALGRLIQCPVAKQPDTVALCSVKEELSGEPIRWESRFDVPRRRLEKVPESLYELPFFPVDAASFVGLLVRAKAVERAGYPDERLFGWFSDWEFCLRLSRQGNVYAVPGSRVVLHEGGSADMERVGSRLRPRSPAFLQLCHSYRNFAYFLRRDYPGWRSNFRLLQLYARTIGGVLMWDRDKRRRFQMLSRAFLEGVRGRLGPLAPE